MVEVRCGWIRKWHRAKYLFICMVINYRSLLGRWCELLLKTTGGGFHIGARKGHIQFIHSVILEAKKTGVSLSTVILEYGLDRPS